MVQKKKSGARPRVPADMVPDSETSEIPPLVEATGSTNETPSRERIVEAEVGGEGVVDVVFEKPAEPADDEDEDRAEREAA